MTGVQKPELETLELVVLVCDRSRYLNDLWSQFGLSILVDCWWTNGSTKRLLFDTGWAAEPLLHNMDKLGVGLETIDTLVLSHCHYDHTGGLERLLTSEQARFNVVAHADITRPVYSGRSYLRYIGLDSPSFDELGAPRRLLVREPTQLGAGVMVTGTIPRVTEFEKPEEGVYVLKDGELRPDPELDDMALVFDVKDEGLVVLTGCSHAGVINTMRHAVQQTQKEHLRALVGGFHLVDLPDHVRRSTVHALSDFDLDEIWSGHCTGWAAEVMIHKVYGERHHRFYTGDRMTFGIPKEERK